MFMIIDHEKNTVVIDSDYYFLVSQLMKDYKCGEIKRHHNQSELFEEIRRFLREQK